MKVIGKVKIGGVVYEFEADEKDELDSLNKVITLANPRMTCNVCKDVGFENKKFTTNKSTTDKGTFTFVNLKCKCGAKSALGQYKTGGYFWKDYEQYQPKAQVAPAQPTSLDDL